MTALLAVLMKRNSYYLLIALFKENAHNSERQREWSSNWAVVLFRINITMEQQMNNSILVII